MTLSWSSAAVSKFIKQRKQFDYALQNASVVSYSGTVTTCTNFLDPPGAQASFSRSQLRSDLMQLTLLTWK